MRLATVRGNDGPRVAVLWSSNGERAWLDVAGAAADLLDDRECPATLRGILERDGPGLETVRTVLQALDGAPLPELVRWWPWGAARLAATVPDPGALLDFYAFEEHVRRARARRGLEVPAEWYRRPVYYRSNQRAVLGPADVVEFPAGETMRDYELEVAAVLGAPLASPSPAEAEAAIAGYCLLNDWSARALQREVMAVGLGPAPAKDFATSLGPWLTTADEVAGRLATVELTARVNGEEWSRGSLAGMGWSWGEMLAFAAAGSRLEPGDVIGSGTIGGGCGLELGRFLAPGDRVELDGGELLGVLAGVVGGGEG